MAHIKIASSQDWNALSSIAPLEVKISSRGLSSNDSHKIAQEVGDKFIHEVRKIEDQLDSNHKYAHVISCGCTELFGPNRNADGWGKEALAKDMNTYLKHAKCFRDHDNKPTSLYYGRPKVAFFDEDRGYGRLLVALHANDSACTDKLARVADREIEDLESKGEIKVSHGSKISFDTCSFCGNNAKTRAQYCDSSERGGKCSALGCRPGLSKIAEDGRVQFVHNDDSNLFYDISAIGMSKNSARQADRIAYASLFEGLDKTAGELFPGAVPGSSWMAEQMGLTARLDLFDLDQLSHRQHKFAKVAAKLAMLEPYSPDRLYNSHVSPVRGLWQLRSLNNETKAAAVRELARRREFIGPQTFAGLCEANWATAKEAEAIAYGGIQRLAQDDKLVELIKTSSYTNAFVSDVGLLPAPIKLPEGDVSEPALSRASKFAALSEPYTAAPATGSEEAAKIALEYLAFKIAYASQIWEDDETEIGFLA